MRATEVSFMTLPIITRSEAKASGLLRYFTGKPCKHGHVEERLVSNGACLQCRKDGEPAYRAANPEKRRDSNRKYVAANREKVLEANRKYAAANREKRVEANRKSRDKKYCAEVSTTVERGLGAAKASGRL